MAKFPNFNGVSLYAAPISRDSNDRTVPDVQYVPTTFTPDPVVCAGNIVTEANALSTIVEVLMSLSAPSRKRVMRMLSALVEASLEEDE